VTGTNREIAAVIATSFAARTAASSRAELSLVELVIDTVVCLTLAKWETVSGQFGGYLTPFFWTTSEV
jgi:hypothetical protein